MAVYFKSKLYDGDMFKASLNENGKISNLSKNLKKQKISVVAPGPVKFSKASANLIFSYLTKKINSGEKNKWCYTIFSELLDKICMSAFDI